MKKLIALFTVLSFTLAAIGQNDTTRYTMVNGYGFTYNRLKAKAALVMPADTVQNKLPGSLVVLNDSLYVRTGVKWEKIGANAAVDTVIMSTRAWRQKGDDSVSALVALRVRISDTASMLLPYLRKSDTSAMLSPYFRKGDTVTLSNRINTKLNISDTAAMLAPYAKAVAGLPIGGTTGQILAKNSATNYDVAWIDNYTTDVRETVKATESINKGQAVYVTGADGANVLVSKASNTSDATSSKTLGLLYQNLATNDQGFVIIQGRLSGLNTIGATAGDPVWLGTNGNLLYGTANKPVAPAHMVYIGVVTRVNSNNGEIFVNVQNGFELEELHNVLITDSVNNQVIAYDSTTRLWKNKTIAQALGYTPANNATTVKYSDTASMLSPYLRDADTATLSNRINLKVNISDTASMLSPYARTSNVNAALALKVNISDTSSMLTPYLRKADTTAMLSPYARTSNVNAALATKLNISDTASMLSPYLKESDTLFLSNRINLKVNISDTSSMLSPYIRAAGYGLTKSGQSLLVDTAAIATRARVQKAVDSLGSGKTNGSGTTNYIPKWTGASTLGNSQIFDNGTNIGIGTTSPAAKLDMRGASNQSIYLISTESTDQNNSLESYRSNGGAWSSLLYKGLTHQFLTGPAGGPLAEAMRIFGNGRVGIGTGSTDAGYLLDVNGTMRSVNGANFATTSGSVGIGTTSPSEKLDVSGTFDVKGVIQSTSSGTNANATLTLKTATEGTFLFQTGNAVSGGYRIYDGVAGAERLRISSAGNVGIGTASPVNFGAGTTTLTVNGTTLGAIQLQNGGVKSFDFYGSGTESRIETGTGNSLVFRIASVEQARFAAGNFGIGTQSPGTYDAAKIGSTHRFFTLESAASSYAVSQLAGNQTTNGGRLGYITFANAANSANYKYVGFIGSEIEGTTSGQQGGRLVFHTMSDASAAGPVERMRITSAGDVGIGTNSPLAYASANTSLEVSGKSTNGIGIMYASNNGKSIVSHLYSDNSVGGVGTQTNQAFIFTTNNTERMRIFNTGNIFMGPSASDAGYRLDVNGTLRSVLGANFATSSGNVGIGTTSPSEKLELYQNSGTSLFAKITNTIGQSGLKLQAGESTTNRATRIDFLNAVASTTTPRWTLINDYNQNGTNDFRFVSASTASALVLTQAGNVGIGTESPSNKLDVSGTFRATGNSTLPGWIFKTTNIQEATDSSSSIWFRRTIDNQLNFTINPVTYQGLAALRFRNFGGGESNFWLSNGRLSFAGGTTESMTLIGSELFVGHSGSPTDAGDYKIQSSGNVRVAGKIDVTSSESIGHNIVRTGTSDIAAQIYSSNAWLLYGAESSTGGSILTGSTQYAAVVGSGYNRPLQFGTNSTVRMEIDSTGLVGINTTAPTERLDVNGKARIRTVDSTSTAMNMLYVDNSGVIKKTAPQTVRYYTDASTIVSGWTFSKDSTRNVDYNYINIVKDDATQEGTATVSMIIYRSTSSFTTESFQNVANIPAAYTPKSIVYFPLPDYISGQGLHTSARVPFTGVSEYSGPNVVTIDPSGNVNVRIKTVSSSVSSGGTNYVIIPITVTYPIYVVQ